MPNVDWGLVGLIVCGLAALRVAHHLGVFREIAEEEGGPLWVAAVVPLIFVFGWAIAGLAAAWAVCYGVYKLVTLPGPLELRARRRQRLVDEREHIMAEARRLGLPIVEDVEVSDA